MRYSIMVMDETIVNWLATDSLETARLMMHVLAEALQIEVVIHDMHKGIIESSKDKK